MKIKRLIALLVATAMTVGMIPSLVFAKELDYEPEEQEVAESSEPEKEEETKPEVKETTKPKAEEPDETKGKEPAGSKGEEPAETTAGEPDETKAEEPEQTQGGEPDETKGEEPAETQGEEPEQTQGEEPSETQGEEPETSGEPIPEDVLKDIEAKLPGQRYTGTRTSDNDSLFDRYVESRFSKNRVVNSRKAILAGQKFTGAYKIMYDQLKPSIAKTANGSVASTKYHINMDASGATVSSWTARQLGVKEVVTLNPSTGSYYIPDAALNALQEKTNIYPVINALLADCPYELYWYNKEKGVEFFETRIGVRYIGNTPALYFTDGMNVGFFVADGYAVDTFKINTSKIARVNTSITNAQKIVSNAAGKSDYDKLVYYSKAICDRVEYDHAAADDATMPYGDPWQLVSVFDNDTGTNVVCEGYAKAFKYLCDLTSFNSSKIYCILASGTMTSGSGSGGHMWNIVKMEDGKNYLVDVTNCDSGAVGYPDKLFLVGYYGGNVSSGYTFKSGTSAVTYVYDSITNKTFNAELVLNNVNYVPAGLSGTCGNNLQWSISGNTLTISGTGDMTNFSYYNGNGAPWEKYSLYIKNVVISDGVTSIGNFAFYSFTAIKNITLPHGLTKIGEYAFAGCVNLTGIKIPNTVDKIGNNAFYVCSNLSRVTIEESLHKKVTGLFDSCPKAVFYDYLVAGDYELMITNPATNGTGTVMFIGMAKPTEAVTVPTVAEINGIKYKVTRIAQDAFFQDNTIKTLVIGANVTVIDANAFYGCANLVKVSGGKGLKTIGSNAFARCPKLSSFVITSKVLSKIGAQSFYADSKLKTLTIKQTKKLTKSGVKNSLKGSSVKTVKVKKSKIRKYKKYFKKSNSGRKVKVKK